MGEYTRFKKVQAEEFKGNVTGNVTGQVNGELVSKATVSTAVDYALTAAEKKSVIGITASAASKAVTLGLKEGQIAFVINEGGTNAFTAKNLAADSGTSIAAGKVALVVASETANTTGIYVLN